MTPTVSNFQVQYLVSFITGLVGDLVNLIAGSIATFGTHVTIASGNADLMANLTSGIFGTQNGLIYWINDKVFYVLEKLPYTEIGAGLNQIVHGLFG